MRFEVWHYGGLALLRGWVAYKGAAYKEPGLWEREWESQTSGCWEMRKIVQVMVTPLVSYPALPEAASADVQSAPGCPWLSCHLTTISLLQLNYSAAQESLVSIRSSFTLSGTV